MQKATTHLNTSNVGAWSSVTSRHQAAPSPQGFRLHGRSRALFFSRGSAHKPQAEQITALRFFF